MQNSIFITFSGLLGGMTKAISSGFILQQISYPQITEVIVYASMSAFVGYMVKLGIDTIRNKVIIYKKRNR